MSVTRDALAAPSAMLLTVALATSLGVSAAGCSGGAGKTSPAARGIQSFVTALRADDPRQAYDLLSADVRETLSFEEFAARWKDTAAEREFQAAALERGLSGDPDLGERAKVPYGDGKSVYLSREGGRWRIESALVSEHHAGEPLDAVKLFAQALLARDYNAVMGVLTSRRRSSVGKQVDAFVTSLNQHLADSNIAIEIIGTDRAEIRWDDGDLRYRIALRREGDDWRVDDIHIRPAPPMPSRSNRDSRR